MYVAPYRINVGLRWAGHECDVIRDGDHIAIFSGNHLVRAFTADPTRYHQPARQNYTYLSHPRTQTGIMSVSDVPRLDCEMTGLDLENDALVEFAVLVTDERAERPRRRRRGR